MNGKWEWIGKSCELVWCLMCCHIRAMGSVENPCCLARLNMWVTSFSTYSGLKEMFMARWKNDLKAAILCGREDIDEAGMIDVWAVGLWNTCVWNWEFSLVMRISRKANW